MDIEDIFKNFEYKFRRSEKRVNSELKKKLFNLEEEIRIVGQSFYDDNYLSEEDGLYIDSNPDKLEEIYAFENLSKNLEFVEAMSSLVDDLILEKSQEIQIRLKRLFITTLRDRSTRRRLENGEEVIIKGIDFDAQFGGDSKGYVTHQVNSLDEPDDWYYSVCLNLFLNNEGELFEYLGEPMLTMANSIANEYGIAVTNITDILVENFLTLSVHKIEGEAFSAWKERGYSISKLKARRAHRERPDDGEIESSGKKRKIDKDDDVDMD